MINHKIYQTAEQVVESLANDMKAFSEMGRPVHISLSGGSTPKMLFKLLASEAYATSIQWQNCTSGGVMSAAWHLMMQKATTVKQTHCCLAK